MDFVNSYLSLAKDISLHELPTGAFIIPKMLETDSPTSAMWFYINETAKNIMINCNGELTAEEISKKTCPDPALNEKFLDTVIPFLKQAVDNGHIIASVEPMPMSANITGSSKINLPLQAIVELTYTCNLRCKHCYVEASPQREERLTYESFIEMADLMCRKGVLLVELTGGEPLMNPDFMKILKASLERFQLTTVLSNGSMVDERVLEQIGDYRNGLVFSVTVFSSTPEYHDYFTGLKGSFERTCRAVQLLTARGINTRVSTIITRENYTDIENIVKMTSKLGATQMTYSPVLDLGRAVGGNWAMTENELTDFLKRIERVNKRWGKYIQVIPEHAIEWVKDRGCGAGWRMITIDPGGNIRPCIMMDSDMIKIGNIFREDYEEIFSSSLVAKLHELKPPSEKICGDCTNLGFCLPCNLRGIMSYRAGIPCTWAADQNIDDLLR